jgi:CRISPR-associated protein Csx3
VAAELRNAAGVLIELLDNGSILAIHHGDVLINQVLGSPVEGAIGNLWLRRRRRGGISSVPLMGPASASRFRTSDDGATWEGSVDGLDYACTLRLARSAATWFWTLRLTNGTGRRMSLDAVLSQDLGIAHDAAVRNSELYTSQYIDHTVLADAELGHLVCSRQNLPQGGAHPWIMHGCLDGAVGYLTDGFQLYGPEFRVTGRPAALARPRLPNRVYQYELALPTLQSRRMTLAPGADGEITFFAAYQADHPAASSTADARAARAAARAFRGVRRTAATGRPRALPSGLFDAPLLFDAHDLGPAELDRYFGTKRRHVEQRDGTILSFFHGEQQHVVLKAKERLVERPTGHMMRSGRDLLPSDELMSVTAWMFGVFASQVTIGNTSFNKLLSECRNPLNVLRSSGLRIFVQGPEGHELLAVPSAFEMGPAGARWIYHSDGLTLAVRVETVPDAPACRVSVEVERGGPVELLLSHNVVVGANELGTLGVASVDVDVEQARVELRPSPDEPMRQRYPDATFFIVSPDRDAIEAIGGDGLLHADGKDRGGAYVVVRTRPVTRFTVALTGSILDAARAADLAATFGAPAPDPDGGEATPSSWDWLGRRGTLGGAAGRGAEDLARLNELMPWYVHDAVIHASAPHGLEQHGGAAWGVRDVCQGPAELFVATVRLEELRAVIRIVYERQLRGSGDWPQWFMFDRFRAVQATDSHADIVLWPLKALCDYVESANDLSILEERVAYTDDLTRAATCDADTILGHTERQIERIERSFLPGTSLMIFGGGDWEDTLQPADPAMAARMVSAWTVELAYQTLGRYRVICERARANALAARLDELCRRMRTDFNRHLVPDGVVAGLAHFTADGIDYFLHPRDRRTGVSYRLLPMTRGMISGMFSAEQAGRHAALIARHLISPDGVRLMDRPMEYHGGTSRWFGRAESAANFGREIGLQYVHAHIRYVEAMARIGRPEEAFRGLLAVCPIGLELDVPSALPRQANAFFSSSDAAFTDRRQASRHFGRVRTGRIGVKGGWRVYSSGPGIFLNQLISNILGLRALFDDLVFDPVLPSTADGLTFDFDYDGRPVRYRYRVSGDGYSPSEVRVNGRRLPDGRHADNPFRPGGLLVSRRAFGEALDRERNIVEVFI